MVTITIEEDCGNAPKKALLRDFTISFAENNAEFILEIVSDDIKWKIVGDQEIREKGDFADAVKELADATVTALTINHVITHGATAAVDGTLLLENGREYGFCDVYEFSGHGKNAKIRTMTSYVIEVGEA